MKKQQGFSLVELMIVVAIIGALTAIAVPAYQDYVKKSEATAGLATLKALQTQAQIHYQETGEFPKGGTALEDIGAKTNMNPLGLITITNPTTEGTEKGSLVFTFGTADGTDSSSSLKGGVLTATLSNTGWECVATLGAFIGDDKIELDACPAAASGS